VSGSGFTLRYTDTIEHDIMNVYVSHFRSPPLTSEHEAVMHKMAGRTLRFGQAIYADSEHTLQTSFVLLVSAGFVLEQTSMRPSHRETENQWLSTASLRLVLCLS